MRWEGREHENGLPVMKKAKYGYMGGAKGKGVGSTLSENGLPVMKKAKYGYIHGGCEGEGAGIRVSENGLPVMKKAKYGQMGGVRVALNLAKIELKRAKFHQKAS